MNGLLGGLGQYMGQDAAYMQALYETHRQEQYARLGIALPELATRQTDNPVLLLLLEPPTA